MTTVRIEPSMLRDPRHLLSLGFGAGLAPRAPGTAGTLVAIPFFLLLAQLPWYTYLAVVGAAFALGVYLCHYTSEALGVHDHSAIVWDELVGYWITMIAIPPSWPWIIGGFVLFRLFDIVKPWPVRLADKRMSGGFGIMFDDVLAGLYALACMHLILLLV